ncbi:anti-sigma B factor RsbT [Vibrio sp. RC586]|uniref:ATP-binding protein n=1 Tax=Vibrio sp. RC586 TaxID=675815 RepID=UPI0001BB7C4F|nr:ATP-binding protein [Vibrio sp. RC586]EEY99696.1 anti-sigma B factor RsbT [Vibrio sp. RC586]
MMSSERPYSSTLQGGKSELFHLCGETDSVTAVMGAYVFARQIGFSMVEVSEIATVVSELATNVFKYAEFGTVEMQLIKSQGRLGIRITVQDKGPGIADIELALQEHFSTGGSLGLGLPGVRRMVDEFSLENLANGTKVSVTKWSQNGF